MTDGITPFVFDDDERRLAARPAHRERLSRLRAEGTLTMAGPWADDSGALLVFRTDERGLRDILAADPYYSTPGVTVVGYRRWTPLALDDEDVMNVRS
ncbi:YciI family protein [Actinoallomurus sp. CA-142502]|uniref:YciI family protein n=1 Tax=Actinoallomurus sp. CA-142502 TaxID=3239885 RepID=UPI003D926BC3